jgi:glycosyltransferase involved in cell wall biosynthesis
MKIAYVTTFDIQNPASWPKRHLGLYSASSEIIQNLEAEQTTVEYLGMLNRKRSPLTRIKWQLYKKIFQKDFYSWADPLVQRHYSRQIAYKLSSSSADILLCPENAIPLANFEPDRPMVLWTDAALGSLIDFYPYLSNLCTETRRNLLTMEKRVMERCSLIILNSEWAAQSAHKLYDVPLSKIRVIPRGTNHIHKFSSENIKTVIEQRKHKPCRLLFIGVEWQRKGGNTALSIAQSLNDRGFKTELHIVGCTPPIDLPTFVKVHGFIDRSTALGQTKMNQLNQMAHFLIYPTRADALGMVINEAASFGVPALASEVGGISSLVKANITGKTFPVDCELDDYCQFIMGCMEDPAKYQSLAYSTYENCKRNLSWLAVGEQGRIAFQRLLR